MNEQWDVEALHRRVYELEQYKIKTEERVKRLEQQHTEPMKVTRVELASADVQSSLDNHTELLKEISVKQDEQEQQLALIYTDVGHMKADVGVLKQQMLEVQADVKSVKATQSDHGEMLKELLDWVRKQEGE